LTQARIALDYAIQVSDWKASAKVMLKQLEPIICELNQELGSVQKCVFELIADQRFEARRQSSRSL
jgi:hypothetical protein